MILGKRAGQLGHNMEGSAQGVSAGMSLADKTGQRRKHILLPGSPEVFPLPDDIPLTPAAFGDSPAGRAQNGVTQRSSGASHVGNIAPAEGTAGDGSVDGLQLFRTQRLPGCEVYTQRNG